MTREETWDLPDNAVLQFPDGKITLLTSYPPKDGPDDKMGFTMPGEDPMRWASAADVTHLGNGLLALRDGAEWVEH